VPGNDRDLSRGRFFFGQELGVGTLEVLYFPILEMPDPSGHFIHQIVIVSDEQDRSIVLLERDIQGLGGSCNSRRRRFAST
jgi:hypothetical protein